MSNENIIESDAAVEHRENQAESLHQGEWILDIEFIDIITCFPKLKNIALNVDTSLTVLVSNQLHIFDWGYSNTAIKVIADVFPVSGVFIRHIIDKAVKQRRFNLAKFFNSLLLEVLLYTCTLIDGRHKNLSRSHTFIDFVGRIADWKELSTDNLMSMSFFQRVHSCRKQSVGILLTWFRNTPQLAHILIKRSDYSIIRLFIKRLLRCRHNNLKVDIIRQLKCGKESVEPKVRPPYLHFQPP